MRRTQIHLLLGAALAFGAIWPMEATADTYGFYGITSNNTADVTTGEAQLTVDVSGYGTPDDSGNYNHVLFTFRNSGPADSSITDVYFDDGTLFKIAGLIDADENGGSSGVDFSQVARPGDLPGGNGITPPFHVTGQFSADSDPPAQPNGVNPRESLGIIFDLLDGKYYGNVIQDMSTGALRVGIHVQGFEHGGSESFVAVPVPATVLLGMLGLGVAGLKLRKLV
jgi:hypothetical protein